MPRRKISRVRNRVRLEESPGWIGKRRRDDWWEGEREKEKDARLLKSPFMVLESSLESQSTFVFAIDSLSLLATPHPPPSSISLPLRQFVLSSWIQPDLYLYVPRIIVYLLYGVALWRISWISEFRWRRYLLTDIDIALSPFPSYLENIWKTSMKIIERKTIHGDEMERGCIRVKWDAGEQ